MVFVKKCFSVKMESALLELESTRLLADKIGAENQRVQLDHDSRLVSLLKFYHVTINNFRCSHCGRTVNPASAIAITPAGEIYHYGCLS